MTAAVTKRFPDDRKTRLSQPIAKIGAQLFSPNAWGLGDIVFLINLPPRIKDSAGGRLFQPSQKFFSRLAGHNLPYG
jgi:hypothetical protein